MARPTRDQLIKNMADEAERFYREQLDKHREKGIPKDELGTVTYAATNAGETAYEAGRYRQAAQFYIEAAQLSDNPEVKAEDYKNAARAYGQAHSHSLARQYHEKAAEQRKIANQQQSQLEERATESKSLRSEFREKGKLIILLVSLGIFIISTNNFTGNTISNVSTNSINTIGLKFILTIIIGFLLLK